MKRYDWRIDPRIVRNKTVLGVPMVTMKECDNGKWVKFDEVEKEKFAGIANAIIVIAADLEKKRLKVGVCNCEENWKVEREFDWSNQKEYDHEWICPAHGYKKL